MDPRYYQPGIYGTLTTPQIREPTERNPGVESRLHSLELACAALWEMLKQKNGYTDEELMNIIKNLDQPDEPQGQSVCPRCGHKMLTHNHARCLWCGCDLQSGPFVPQQS